MEITLASPKAVHFACTFGGLKDGRSQFPNQSWHAKSNMLHIIRVLREQVELAGLVEVLHYFKGHLRPKLCNLLAHGCPFCAVSVSSHCFEPICRTWKDVSLHIQEFTASCHAAIHHLAIAAILILQGKKQPLPGL